MPGDYQEFCHHLACGTPSVVKNIQLKGTQVWNPAYFIQYYGSDIVTVINCETGQEKKQTVSEFMTTMGVVSLPGHIWKLKVCYQAF